jgi:hypothetical protein
MTAWPLLKSAENGPRSVPFSYAPALLFGGLRDRTLAVEDDMAQDSPDDFDWVAAQATGNAASMSGRLHRSVKSDVERSE